MRNVHKLFFLCKIPCFDIWWRSCQIKSHWRKSAKYIFLQEICRIHTSYLYVNCTERYRKYNRFLWKQKYFEFLMQSLVIKEYYIICTWISTKHFNKLIVRLQLNDINCLVMNERFNTLYWVYQNEIDIREQKCTTWDLSHEDTLCTI